MKGKWNDAILQILAIHKPATQETNKVVQIIQMSITSALF